MTNIQLVIVDPQNDFCVADSGAAQKQALIAQGMSQADVARIVDPYAHKGALVVAGAHDDMKRVAAMIDRLSGKLDDIHVTLDSHQTLGIERPGWFKNAKDGSDTPPFTLLGLDSKNRIVRLDPASMSPTDVEYTTVKPSLYEPARKYLRALAAGGRYPHCIWTTHCVVGTWGWSVVPEVSAALCRWEQSQFARVDYVVKGNNPNTEHFSAVKAEVPDPDDPSTHVNTGLMETLEKADLIPFTGEALSHCVANTGRDIAALFSDPKYVQKIVLLTDASSNVGGFEFLGNKFVQDMTKLGMQISTTVDFLA